jgi:integrase
MGPTHRRLPPFIYSNEDISDLMAVCDSLFSIIGLRPHTMRTLIGLLASTGLRPGEAVRLKQQEINLREGELIINGSKGWVRRIVPASPGTIVALTDYQQRRDQLLPCRTSDAFFVTDRGQPLDIRAAGYAFGLLCSHLGLLNQNTDRRPRLYDIRHTFVCNRILAWYKTDEFVDSLMPQLSQYIGHKKVSDTYWYIQAVPTLMSIAAHRFESHQRTAGGDR